MQLILALNLEDNADSGDVARIVKAVLKLRHYAIVEATLEGAGEDEFGFPSSLDQMHAVEICKWERDIKAQRMQKPRGKCN